LSVALGLASVLALASHSALAQTQVSCAREYTAKRAADQTAGLTKADYLTACLAGQRTSADSEPAGAARDADTDLAKKTENPIADLISVPFNNYSTFNYGGKGTFNLLEIQPVIPIHLTPDWNVITRTVVPVVWTPDLSPIPTVLDEPQFRGSGRRVWRPRLFKVRQVDATGRPAGFRSGLGAPKTVVGKPICEIA